MKRNTLLVFLLIGCLFTSNTFASDDTPTSTITESGSDSIEYDIVGVVVACITIVGGILLLGFGQRLFKLALALVGLLVVGLAIGTLVNKILLDQGNNLHYVWATVAGVGSGAIAAIILYCMFVIGLLLLGICVGAGLGFVIIALIGAPVLNIAWLSWLIVCVLAAIVGVAFVLLRKRVLILGTSFLEDIALFLEWIISPIKNVCSTPQPFIALSNKDKRGKRSMFRWSPTFWPEFGLFWRLSEFWCRLL